MKNVFNKSSRRNIYKTFGRYLSLIGVTFLGAGVFAGLLAIAPEMRETADNYFTSQNLMDVRVQSPLGFNQDDLDKIEAIDEIETFQEGAWVDTIGEVENTKYTVRIHRYSDNTDKINQLNLLAGHLPRKAKEAVIILPPAGLENIELNKQIKLDSDHIAGVIEDQQFEIVGIVQSGMYPHNKQATTSQGSGSIDFVLFASESSFNKELLSEIFIKFKSTDKLNSFSDSYEDEVEKGLEAIKKISSKQAKTRHEEVERKVLESEKEYVESKAKAESEINNVEKQLTSVKIELDKQKELLSQQTSQLETNKALVSNLEYDSIKSELEQAREILGQNEAEYQEKNAKLEKQKQNANDELADVQVSLNETKSNLDEIKTPQWYFETRNQNQGYAIYKGDAQSMAGMATIFPIIFFLVAALVSLTTMTRMIDDERILIGTFKSMGYSNGKIAWRYLGYSISATIIGSTAGVILGFKVLPQIVWKAYSHQYSIPDPSLRFHWSFALVSILAMLIITTFVTFVTIRSNLKEASSDLLTPKAPPAGKRILLERVSFIWKKLSFSQKVTQRNIFLDKKRMTMTVIGVVGSTALLVTGFALRNSADQFPKQQYENIMNYSLVATLKEKGADSEEFQNALIDSTKISNSVLIKEESIEIESSSSLGDRHYINLVTPENYINFKNFVNMKNQNKDVKFEKDSAVLTDNIANILNVKAGDKIKIKLLDDASFKEITVTDVAKNLEMNYLYLTKEKYNGIFDKELVFNKSFINKSNTISSKALEDYLNSQPAINNVELTENKMVELEENLKSIDMVVVIMIVLASMLALVVLYNVTNINIEERKREIATIKVLGFYSKETNAYVFRETIGLSVMGVIIGLFLGVFLFLQVIQSIETEFYVFDKTLNFKTFIYATSCVLIYTLFVNLIMIPKIRKIDMLESLKSNE